MENEELVWTLTISWPVILEWLETVDWGQTMLLIEGIGFLPNTLAWARAIYNTESFTYTRKLKRQNYGSEAETAASHEQIATATGIGLALAAIPLSYPIAKTTWPVVRFAAATIGKGLKWYVTKPM